VWGLYHGLLLIAYRIFAPGIEKADSNRPLFHYKRILQMILMFHLICVSWLLFRAESMSQVWIMLVQIVTNFNVTGLSIYGVSMIAFFVVPMLVLELWTEKTGNLLVLLNASWVTRLVVYLYFIFMMIIFPPLVSQEFIYFQF
jgi:hypothetical protein